MISVSAQTKLTERQSAAISQTRTCALASSSTVRRMFLPLTVNNVDPVIDSLSVTPEIDENGTVTLTGTYSDVGTLDTHTIDVDWGPGEIDRRIGEAFMRLASEASSWMSVAVHHGLDAAPEVYADLAAGRANPQEGHVIRLT